MSGVKAAGLDYGRMRLWGSLSFIAASIGGGWVVERLGPGVRRLAGRRRRRADGCGRARARAADRARPAQGRDQPAAPRPCRRARACCARASSSSSCWRAAPCRPRTPCSTPSARCTGARWACPPEWCGALWAISIVARDRAVRLLAARWCARIGAVAADRARARAAAVVRWSGHGLRSAAGAAGAAAGAARAHVRRDASRRHPFHRPRGAGGAGRHGAGALRLRHRRHRHGRRHAARRAALRRLSAAAPIGRWRRLARSGSSRASC